METPVPDGISTKPVLSPDGRLRLDCLPWPDPRTRYEAENFWGMDLIDVGTGRRIGQFGLVDYTWPAEGGIALQEMGTVLIVAPDLESFTALADGPRVFPIGELHQWQRRRADSLRPEAADPPPREPAKWYAWLALGVTILVIAVGVIAFFGQLRLLLPTAIGGRPAPSQITGWAVTCPGIGFAPMHLDQDGRLEVPREIAPAPLPPVEGGEGAARRFGEGRVMVEVVGTEVTWWPQGPSGPAVACASLAGRRR